MKKFDLIHTTLLIVAILSGYSALQYLFSLLASLTYSGIRGPAGVALLYNFLVMGFYVIACIILIKGAKKYTVLILKNEPEALAEDAPKWDLDRRNVIFVLFIGIGLNTLIQYLPFVVTNIFQLFRDKVSRTQAPGSGVQLIAVELLRVIAGFFLIYAAPNLTNFIEKNIAVRLNNSDGQSTENV